jgi:hypothetical protein
MKNIWLPSLGLSAILAGSIGLAGCSSLTSVPAGADLRHHILPASKAATVAYMIGSPSTEVAEYSTIPANHGSSIGTLTLPPSFWAGPVATDSGGQIYVAAAISPVDPQNLGDVFIYPPNSNGTATPSRTIDVNSYDVSALAVDHADLLYVAISNGSDATPSVSVYPATASGKATPIRTLQLTNVLQVNDIAVDGAGNLYVAGYMSPENAIAVYSPTATGPATPTRTITFTNSNVYGVAVAATGEIFASVCVDCENTDFVVEEFAPGASGPAAPINTINLTVESRWQIVNGGPVRLDGAGNIFTSLQLTSNSSPEDGIVLYGFLPDASGDAVPNVQVMAQYNTFFALN